MHKIAVYKPYRINDSLTSEPQTKKEVYEKKFVTHDFSENVKSRVNIAGAEEGIKFAWDPDAVRFSLAFIQFRVGLMR